MRLDKISFRQKIFLASFITGIFFFVLMSSLHYYQNNKNFNTLKEQEIHRIENNVKETFHYLSSQNKNLTDNLIQERIYELANVHNIRIAVFEANGHLLFSSHRQNQQLNNEILKKINTEKKYLDIKNQENSNIKILNSYSTFLSEYNDKINILNIQKIENKYSALPKFSIFLKQHIFLILFLIIICFFFSLIISKTLTKKIQKFSQKLKSTNVHHLEEPLKYDSKDEITPLVQSYNQMLKQLQKQKQLLQKNERNEAWKEMARQMAHEINNPLTPLRLTVQNFQRKYNPNDENNKENIKKLTQTIVHHIDTIAGITKSFSDYAKMPINKIVEIDVVDTIRQTISIFSSNEVSFTSNIKQLNYKIDPLYLTRIITNVVKNGLQAIPKDRNKKVDVELISSKDKFTISITDNGTGISQEHKPNVFLTNFTTKEEGMGLGLSMVKKIVEDYGGKIWFETQIHFGTTFFIEFYKN